MSSCICFYYLLLLLDDFFTYRTKKSREVTNFFAEIRQICFSKWLFAGFVVFICARIRGLMFTVPDGVGVLPGLPLPLQLSLHLRGPLPLHLRHYGHLRDCQALLRPGLPSH